MASKRRFSSASKSRRTPAEFPMRYQTHPRTIMCFYIMRASIESNQHGRPIKPIVLSDEERDKLREWARRPKTIQRFALRARIVLGCADGTENREVARQLRITDQTVCRTIAQATGLSPRRAPLVHLLLHITEPFDTPVSGTRRPLRQIRTTVNLPGRIASGGISFHQATR